MWPSPTRPYQDVYGQLIQPLVGQPLFEDFVLIEWVRQQCARALFGILAYWGSAARRLAQRLQNLLNLSIGVPACGLVFQNQVSTHAAAGEVLHSLVIL